MYVLQIGIWRKRTEDLLDELNRSVHSSGSGPVVLLAPFPHLIRDPQRRESQRRAIRVTYIYLSIDVHASQAGEHPGHFTAGLIDNDHWDEYQYADVPFSVENPAEIQLAGKLWDGMN
jgi:hypothetical protein